MMETYWTLRLRIRRTVSMFSFTMLPGLMPCFRDMLFKKFLRNNDYIAIIALISLIPIGSLIYLAAVLSIIKERPSKCLLYASVVFLLFSFIGCIYTTFHIFSNDVFENLLDTDIEKKAEEFLPTVQVMRITYRFAQIIWILGLVLSLFNLVNVVMIFSSIIKDLKMKEIRSTSRRRRNHLVDE